MGEKPAVDNVLFIIKCVSVAMGTVSIGCIICGVLTLTYAAPTFAFPYSTGSGIWTGIVTLLIFVFGMRFTAHYCTDNPSASKCDLLAFYVFIVMDITMGSLNTTYSGLGLASCINNSTTDSGQVICTDDNLSYVCGFNTAFGCVVMLVALATTLYMNIGRKLRWLLGYPIDIDAPYATCCNGKCKCYFYSTVA
ncbi:hypothetical protein ACF0H5_007993 [Mactra antiquata]